MTTYWDSRFIQHIDNMSLKTIFEVGARYGDESIMLSKYFTDAKVYSFECNPLTIDICKKNLSVYPNIIFFGYGLGDKNEELPFYSCTKEHEGNSSLFKRIDFEDTQTQSGYVKIRKLKDVIAEHNIKSIDLFCMDVQGNELNVLKGCEDFIQNIKYIIMEEPKAVINTYYLPEGVHSKYIDSPTAEQLYTFMVDNGFELVERIDENAIEDNVMYRNTRF